MAEKRYSINKLDNLLDEELALINKYTRRQLSKDEVYVFSVVLCDNDIDRDGERFTVESLFALEKLFVGRTGIIYHNPSAKNQTARIFSCAVEVVKGRKTATGNDYFRLKAKAYIPRCESNRDVIAAIDSGIIKEVSIGCAVEKTVCSICGEDMKRCFHRKGENYGGKVCCGELLNPYDAYEWSFVAELSTKQCEKTYIEREEIIKRIKLRIDDYSRDCNSFAPKMVLAYKEFLYMVENLPTADVQEVVKCENCRYRGDGDICPMFHLCWSVNEGYYWEDFTMDNKFCSYGAKMDKECEK